MKILGVDYGKKWIGLSISDDEGKLAFPYKTLKNSERLFDELNEIIKKEDIYKIVVGLPLNKQMKPTPQTAEVENWTEKLVKKVEVPVDFENEVLTSREAGRYAPKDEHAAAAAIFLQSYLDRAPKT